MLDRVSNLGTLNYNVSGLLLSCRIKASCLHVGPGLVGKVPFVGVSLRDTNPYSCDFRRKPRKTQND